MAGDRIEVRLCPDDRRLLLRLVEAVEKLGGGRFVDEVKPITEEAWERVKTVRVAERAEPIGVQVQIHRRDGTVEEMPVSEGTVNLDEGDEIVTSDDVERRPRVVDLMEALEASLAATKKKQDGA